MFRAHFKSAQDNFSTFVLWNFTNREQYVVMTTDFIATERLESERERKRAREKKKEIYFASDAKPI